MTSIGTRSTSKKRRGGQRPGAGRPKRRDTSMASAARRRQADRLKTVKAQRDMMTAHARALSNSRGRSLTGSESRLILRMMLMNMLSTDVTQTDMLHNLSDLTGISYDTLHRLYSHWRKTQELLILPVGNRGGASMQHKYHDTQLPMECIITIHRVLMERSRAGETTSSSDLLSELQTAHSISVSQRGIAMILNNIGYRYGKANFIGAMNDVARRQRIRTFLSQYSAALKEKDIIIVFTDESYVHSNHSRTMTWYNPLVGNAVYKDSGGKRLIILHAMCAYGLVVKVSRDGMRTTASEDLDDICQSAELIYEGVTHDGDYHSCMNGQIYIKWLKNRLIPAFKAMFPKKRMCLVLDNARYHHVRGDDYMTPSTMNKKEVLSKLRDFDITSIKVQRPRRDGVMVERDLHAQSWLERGGPWAPRLDELRKELQKYITCHPELESQKTEVQKLFKKHNYELIYTPPYTPTCQPIELMWAFVKNYVARKYHTKRNMTELREQTLTGCYGDATGEHEGMTPERCKSLIRHSQEWMNMFIEQDSLLSGDIYDLGGNVDIEYTASDIGNDIEEEAEPLAEDGENDIDGE